MPLTTAPCPVAPVVWPVVAGGAALGTAVSDAGPRAGRAESVCASAAPAVRASAAAISRLEAVVARETDERGSPLMASAMVGLAHLGTQPAVERLITQASGPNDAQALNALQRVATRQGVELLRSAAAGGKGYEALTANQRATFGRVADVAAAALAKGVARHPP